MKVTFYGTRGSIPVCARDCVQVGGNTSCILVTSQVGRIGILDAGTGIRRLGNDLLAQSLEQYDNIFVGFSHTHWDHIQGFPFFKLAYNPRRNFTLSICGKDREGQKLEVLMTAQMQREYFPVSLNKMGAAMSFWEPDVTTYVTPAGVSVEASKHTHPGGAFGYRLEEEGKTLVYCTDVEHMDGIDPNVVALSRDADLLIHDAQYTPEELKQKRA